MTGNSGTYSFGTASGGPAIGSLALNAFARCGVRRTEIGTQHLEDIYLEINLLQSEWAADGITWWTVELLSQPLTQGVATYNVPTNVVSVLDVYINNGAANRLILGFSRTDYASIAEPQQQAFPTVFWFNRALSPTITLWPVPDGNAVYTMGFYAYTVGQDAVVGQGGTPAIPQWWYDALVAGLAYRLSRSYAPQLEDKRKQDYLDAYAKACKQNEFVPLYIHPGLAGYYRS